MEFTAIYEIEVHADDADDVTQCIYREIYVIRDMWADDAQDRAESQMFYLRRLHAGDFATMDRIAYVD